MKTKSLLILAAALALTTAAKKAPENHGRFEGKLQVEVLDDGRNMKLLAPFTYVDNEETTWTVPTGWIVNGASIPKIFWGIIGSPYVGKYRNASVVHDYLCDQRTITWEKTHRIFYEASLAGGVDEAQASIMYGAVYMGGPRWTDPAATNTEKKLWFPEITPDQMKQIMQDLTQNALTLKDIETKLKTLPDLRTYLDPAKPLIAPVEK